MPETKTIPIVLSETAKLLSESNQGFSAQPRAGTKHSAGYDVFACIKEPIAIYPEHEAMIPLGISFNLLKDSLLSFLIPTSGVKDYILANTIGLIDPDYTGELKARIRNISKEILIIPPMEKIGQVLFFQAQFVEFTEIPSSELPETERGGKGFGKGTELPPLTLKEATKKGITVPNHFVKHVLDHFSKKIAKWNEEAYSEVATVIPINQVPPKLLINSPFGNYCIYPEQLLAIKYFKNLEEPETIQFLTPEELLNLF